MNSRDKADKWLDSYMWHSNETLAEDLTSLLDQHAEEARKEQWEICSIACHDALLKTNDPVILALATDACRNAK